MLVKSNIQHDLVQISVKIEREGFETVRGALYLSTSKTFKEDGFNIPRGLAMSGKFIFGDDLNSKRGIKI